MKIKIKLDIPCGTETAHIKVGDVLETIPEPRAMAHLADMYPGAVWIMGKTEPVKVLPHEFEFVKEEEIIVQEPVSA